MCVVGRYTHSVAIPPTIPTSFVPKQPVVTRKSTLGFNPFLIVSYLILGIWLLVAGLVLGYELYLSKIADQKRQELVTAQNNIDQATVNDFIRLRDRFTVAKGLLNKHIVLSHFFDDIENITIQNVSFSGLRLTVKDTGIASVEMRGVARNFNALAAQSTAFANDKRFKRAIFSGFNLDSKSNTVTFQINADIDPALITDSANSYVPPVQNTSIPTPAPTTTNIHPSSLPGAPASVPATTTSTKKP